MEGETNHTDSSLLTQLKTGDRAAFDMLYHRYWLQLYDAAYKRLGNKEQAEDIVQELFIRLWVRRNELVIDHLPAYLHTAVRYSVLSYVTRNKASLNFYLPFETILLETGADMPDDRLMAKELLELAYDYANTLPERKKQVLLLHIKNKLSTREIADELNISQKTVQNQLGAALKGLRANIAPLLAAFIAARF